MELQRKFSPQELEFFAEDELVSIIPNFSLPSLGLIRDTFGPFTPQLSIDVPLYLAIALKRNKKCKIQPPSWMDVEVLRRKIQDESATKERWEEMPAFFLDVGILLLKHASDDIPNSAVVRELLTELWEKRAAKITYHLHKLEPDAFLVQMSNLTPLEISYSGVRSILNDTMACFLAMETPEEEQQ